MTQSKNKIKKILWWVDMNGCQTKPNPTKAQKKMLENFFFYFWIFQKINDLKEALQISDFLIFFFYFYFFVLVTKQNKKKIGKKRTKFSFNFFLFLYIVWLLKIRRKLIFLFLLFIIVRMIREINC